MAKNKGKKKRQWEQEKGKDRSQERKAAFNELLHQKQKLKKQRAYIEELDKEQPKYQLHISSRDIPEKRQFKVKRAYDFSEVQSGEDIFNTTEKTLGCKIGQFVYYEPIEKDDKLYLRAMM